MSRLADVKNMNESIVQGDIYEKQKNLTLGTFKSLQGNDNKTIYKSIETFLSDSLQTDGDDEQVGDNNDETYSDLTLSELYSIYKDKVELLEAELETLKTGTLYSSSGIYNDGEQKYFYTEDSGTYSFQDIWQGDSAMDTIAGTDSLTDSTKFPDSINLTCGLMAETDDDTVFGDSALPTPEDNDDLAETDAVCNPFSSGADNFSKAILYITQLNKIVSEMKSKADDGTDDSLNIDDLDKSLKDYQARYNFMLKYKTSSAVAASNSDDISNKPGSLRDSSSGYLEAETLKYDSAKMLYVSLLLGSVVAGAITVSTIINSNN